jgi:hypothetical protein
VRLLDAIASATPHGDDFDAPDSTFAQDAAICVDAALRAAFGQQLNPQWIEYALEPMTAALAVRDLRDARIIARG